MPVFLHQVLPSVLTIDGIISEKAEVEPEILPKEELESQFWEVVTETYYILLPVLILRPEWNQLSSNFQM